MTQFAMAFFGLAALYIRWARTNSAASGPVVGLIGQPAWFAFAIDTEAWGLLANCIAYAAIYVHAIWLHWGKQCKYKSPLVE
jgi:hypothetical protein